MTLVLRDATCAAMDRPLSPPITVSISQAAQCIGVSKSTIKRLIGDGRLLVSKIGEDRNSKVLVHYDSLLEFVKSRTVQVANPTRGP